MTNSGFCGTRSVKLLGKTEEAALFARFEKDDRDAGDKIAEHYKPLVYSLSNRLWRRNNCAIDKDELRSAGYEGLATALNRFDASRGVRFSTYARFFIVRKMYDCVRLEKWWAPTLPEHMYRTLMILARQSARLRVAKGYEPSIDELATSLEVHPEMLRRILPWMHPDITSLSTPTGDSGDNSLSDFMVIKQPSPEQQSTIELNKKAVRKILQGLSTRERRVIKLRFGLDGKGERTLSVVGTKLGITPERARQIERTALNALRDQNHLKLRQILYGYKP